MGRDGDILIEINNGGVYRLGEALVRMIILIFIKSIGRCLNI